MIVECENEPTWGVCQNPILPRRPLPRDARIRAMVLADPVFGAIFASGLAGMTIPVQLGQRIRRRRHVTFGRGSGGAWPA